MLAVVEAAQMIIFQLALAALGAEVMGALQATPWEVLAQPTRAVAAVAVERLAQIKTVVLAVRVLSNLDTPTPKQFQILAAG